MKTVNRICQILAIVFGLASLVLFFTQFVTFITGDSSISAVGAQLAFGSTLKDGAGAEFDMARSAKIQLCFWLTAIGFIMSIFSFKSKGLRYAVPGIGLFTAIYMLVVALSNPWRFVDTRPITGVTGIKYAPFVLICAIALCLFAAASVAYLLISDHLEVAAGKKKLTIPKRVVQFFRDYKSEITKIVWPSFKDVAKNTGIVLIMCLLVGILIWVLDFGLGQLLKLVLGITNS